MIVAREQGKDRPIRRVPKATRALGAGAGLLG
jgi:hypothetical protein